MQGKNMGQCCPLASVFNAADAILWRNGVKAAAIPIVNSPLGLFTFRLTSAASREKPVLQTKRRHFFKPVRPTAFQAALFLANARHWRLFYSEPTQKSTAFLRLAVLLYLRLAALYLFYFDSLYLFVPAHYIRHRITL